MPTHWVCSTPTTKPAELRGFHCGAPFDNSAASSYREQVTCEACLTPEQTPQRAPQTGPSGAQTRRTKGAL